MLIPLIVLLSVFLMARLSEAQSTSLARVVDACLDYARQEMRWNWDEMAANLGGMDVAQLKRIREGREGFDFKRLLLLPVPAFAAFQAKALEMRDATEEAAPHFLAAIGRAWLASRGLARMARATVQCFEARKERASA